MLLFILFFIADNISLFVHVSVDGRLGFFHLIAIMNHAVINIRVQVIVWPCVFTSPGCTHPRRGIIYSLGHVVTVSNILRAAKHPPTVCEACKCCTFLSTCQHSFFAFVIRSS